VPKSASIAKLVVFSVAYETRLPPVFALTSQFQPSSTPRNPVTSAVSVETPRSCGRNPFGKGLMANHGLFGYGVFRP